MEISKTKQTADKSFDVQIIDSRVELPFRYKNDHYEILAKNISYDTARTKLILESVISHLNQGHKILLLTERKDHIIEFLEKQFKKRKKFYEKEFGIDFSSR